MPIRIETWKNGNTYSVNRDLKGRFAKGGYQKIDISKYKVAEQYFKEPEKKEQLYRMSMIISDVPVRSDREHNKPNYLGFRLTAFSTDRNYLSNQKTQLKQELIRLASDYLGYGKDCIFDWEGYEVYIGYEPPTEVSGDLSLNNTWFFVVEREGREQHGTSGHF